MDHSNPETDVIDQIENNEFYKSFLESGLRNSALPQALKIAKQLKKLAEGIELIIRELEKQVFEKHDDLLKQGNYATNLENVLSIMNGQIQNLSANAERLRNEVTGLFNGLETDNKVLNYLSLAMFILREVNRIQQLSKRLSNTNDPVQKATILDELDQMGSDPFFICCWSRL